MAYKNARESQGRFCEAVIVTTDFAKRKLSHKALNYTELTSTKTKKRGRLDVFRASYFHSVLPA